MKLKTLSLVAGVIALSIGVAPFAVQAQTNTPARLLLAQGHKDGAHGPMQDLGLTDQQKSQMQEIHRNTRAQMEKIFTPEQLAKLKAARQNGHNRQDWKQTMSSLNLSDDQKTQLQQLKQSERQQMDGILTAEQKQKLQQHQAEWRARHQQNNPNSSPDSTP